MLILFQKIHNFNKTNNQTGLTTAPFSHIINTSQQHLGRTRMAKLTFKRQFLKHADKFQDCDGAYEFTINDTDYTLDTTSSGRVLLWRDYGTLVAWTEDWDYAAVADIAEQELETV